MTQERFNNIKYLITVGASKKDIIRVMRCSHHTIEMIEKSDNLGDYQKLSKELQEKYSSNKTSDNDYKLPFDNWVMNQLDVLQDNLDELRKHIVLLENKKPKGIKRYFI